jgi:dihydropteroate synthase
MQKILLEYPNVGFYGNGKTLPVAPVVEEEMAEKCGACVMVMPMLRKKIDDARVLGRQRQRAHFLRQALEPMVACGQQIVRGVCLPPTRNVLLRLGRSVMHRLRLSRRLNRLLHKALPLRVVVQQAIAAQIVD